VSATTAPTTSVRPEKPARPWTHYLALLFVVAFTIFASLESDVSLREVIDNISRANRLIGEFWPPNWAVFDNLIPYFIETFQIAILGTVAGCLLSLPVAFLAGAPTAPNAVVRSVTRFLMGIFRTMPDLFWAMLFVAGVGPGGFAGFLAMAIFSSMIMAKLFSETIDAVDTGSLEAVRAAGANQFSADLKAVWPQVRPQFVAYALYIFELLIRAGVVLGLVGAGGVGTQLNKYRQFFQYDNVMVIVLVTLVIVLILEALSAFARKRLL
jgi:phosphonate transport system permease protein